MIHQNYSVLSTANAKAQVALQTIGVQDLTGTLKTLQTNTLHGLYALLGEITGVQMKVRAFVKDRQKQLKRVTSQRFDEESLDETNKLFGQIRAEAASLKGQVKLLSDGIESELEFLRPTAREGMPTGMIFYRVLADLNTQLSLLQNELKFVIGNFNNIHRDSAPQTNRETAKLYITTLVQELQDLAREVS